MTKQTFTIEGMSCAHCVAKVEGAINELPGIEKVKINLKKGRGVVKFDEGKTSSSAIATAATNVGYVTKEA